MSTATTNLGEALVSQHIKDTDNHSAEHVHVHRDHVGAKFGMWLFLFTEVLLFGGLFFLYFGYRVWYSEAFHNAAKELNIVLGTANTVILLTSSLTMALSILALRKNKVFWSLVHLTITILCAFGFLINKYFEWGYKIHHGIYPGSETLASRPAGEIVFFGLYYLMTGLHTIHIVIGIVILSVMWVGVYRRKINADYYTKLENGGLYWHLVDLIWIYLFPLFYLLH